MGQLIQINSRKLNRSSPCLLVQLKGLVNMPVFTCRMDGWVCVASVPDFNCSVLGMFSTFKVTLFQMSNRVHLPLFFSPLFFGNDVLMRVQNGVRYVGVHVWEPTKSAASCMCWSASSVHVDFLCVFRGQSPLVLPSFLLLHSAFFVLASHTDVAGLAAGVLLGVYRGQTHQLVPADLSHRAQRQV